MTQKAYLHIGPPKTASTSLQIALQCADLNGIHYAGVWQPRAEFDNTLTDYFHARRNPDVDTGISKEVAVSNFQNIISSGKSIFISEEMLVVGRSKFQILERLENSINFFQRDVGIPVQILMTLREPGQAIPSYYQEIFKFLPVSLASDFNAFCRDERNFCYDYAAISDHVVKCGASVGFLEFDEIASGSLDLQKVLGRIPEKDLVLKIGRENTGQKADTARILPGVSLVQYYRSSWLFALRRMVGLKRLPFGAELKSLFGEFSFRKHEAKELVVPSDVLQYYKSSLINARQVCNSKKGQGI